MATARHDASGPRSVRRLYWIYAFTVLVLVVVVFGSEAWLHARVVDRPREAAAWINTAGRQRMLAERILSDATLLPHLSEAGGSEEVRAQLLDTLDRWLGAQGELDRTLTDSGVDPRIGAVTAPIAPLVESIASAVRTLTARGPDRLSPAAADAVVDRLRRDERRFVARVEALIALQESAFERRSEEARRVEQLLIGAVLGTAIAAGFALLLLATRGIRHEFGDRVRAEARLQAMEARRRLAAIVESSQDAIIGTSHGTITSWNRGAERMYGWTVDEAIGRSIKIIVPTDLHGEMDEILAGVRANGPPQVRDTERVRKDGTRLHVALSVSPIADEQGNLVGASAIAHDITELWRARQEVARQRDALEAANTELERSNADLEQFASAASHDLQEPLRKIISFSELLREDVGGDLPEAAQKDLEVIVDGALRMRSMVRALLSLSRVGSAALERTTVDLGACVDRALEALELRISETGAEITRDELPSVSGDATLLTALYQNLMSNALKFVDSRSPRVHLSAERTEAGWLLGVRDNGIGLDPEHAEQIFRPFRRLHARGHYEGTGIGLAICRKAVERHGGRIWVESATGEGAHFRFTLGA